MGQNKITKTQQQPKSTYRAITTDNKNFITASNASQKWGRVIFLPFQKDARGTARLGKKIVIQSQRNKC